MFSLIKSGETALLRAAKDNRWDIVTKLIDSGAANVDASDRVSDLLLIHTYI